MSNFSRLFKCMFLELFVLFPLCSVCFGMSVPCLLYVVHSWMCLCYILLHVYALCISFGTVALSDLCKSIHFSFYTSLLSYMLPLVVLVVGVYVWC
jgi:hypothetical protein